MNQNYRKRLIDLMRTDFITMNGGKNNVRMMAILMTVICGGIGFLMTPVFGLYVPLLMGGFFVPMLFQNETKYHSAKMFALLPIDRKDLVRSRFLLSTGLYLIVCLFFYFLMLLAFQLKISYWIMGEEDAEMIDLIRLAVRRSNGQFTELGFFNLLYFFVFSFGLTALSSGLQKYFKDGKNYLSSIEMGSLRKTEKRECVYAFLVFGIILLWILIVSDILPLGSAAALFLQLFLQLVEAANGFLLGIVLVTTAVCYTYYKYVSTLLEYDEREL